MLDRPVEPDAGGGAQLRHPRYPGPPSAQAPQNERRLFGRISGLSLQNDGDKAVLASNGFRETTGLYSAYRIVQFGLLPVSTLVGVSYQRFLQRRGGNKRQHLRRSLRSAGVTAVYGVVFAVFVLLIAPILPRLMGEEFQGSVEMVRWLTPLVVLRAWQADGRDRRPADPLAHHEALRPHGFNDFVVCLGYKGESSSATSSSTASRNDLTVDLGTTVECTTADRPRLAVTWSTPARHHDRRPLKRVRHYLGDGTFMLTYGDGVADVDIRPAGAFHEPHGKLATVTAVQPPARFGELDIDGDRRATLRREAADGDGWINGGFFVLEPGVFDYIPATSTGRGSRWRLAARRPAAAFKHEGFWQCMDTLRDKIYLNALWDQGCPPAEGLGVSPGPADPDTPNLNDNDSEPKGNNAMKVLLTGADGIGVRMGHVLLERGHDVTGLDSGFHRVGWLYNSDERRPTITTKDTRHITVEDLQVRRACPSRRGVERSVGELNQDVTYINHQGSLPLAEKGEGGRRRALRADVVVQRVRRLGRQAERGGRPTEPLTSYAGARCSSNRTSPRSPTTTSRRRSCATRPRTVRRPGSASTSSSTTWPPRRTSTARSAWPATGRHGGRSCTCSTSPTLSPACSTPRVTSCTTRSSTSARTTGTTRFARSPRSSVVGARCELIFGDSSADKRNYRADFTKIHEQLPRLPVLVGRRARRQGHPRHLRPHRIRRGALPLPWSHPDQADQAPARHGADRRRLLLDLELRAEGRRRHHYLEPPGFSRPGDRERSPRTSMACAPSSTTTARPTGHPSSAVSGSASRSSTGGGRRTAGRHANMTCAFTESDADHLIMVFDDEELLPGAIGAMLDRAADDPTAAFVAGRFLYRDADGRTMRRLAPGAGGFPASGDGR